MPATIWILFLSQRVPGMLDWFRPASAGSIVEAAHGLQGQQLSRRNLSISWCKPTLVKGHKTEQSPWAHQLKLLPQPMPADCTMHRGLGSWGSLLARCPFGLPVHEEASRCLLRDVDQVIAALHAGQHAYRTLARKSSNGHKEASASFLPGTWQRMWAYYCTLPCVNWY